MVQSNLRGEQAQPMRGALCSERGTNWPCCVEVGDMWRALRAFQPGFAGRKASFLVQSFLRKNYRNYRNDISTYCVNQETVQETVSWNALWCRMIPYWLVFDQNWMVLDRPLRRYVNSSSKSRKPWEKATNIKEDLGDVQDSTVV